MIGSALVAMAAFQLAAGPPLGLHEVLSSAEAHHPTVAIALLDAVAARDELLAQEGAFDPLVRARALGDVGYYDNGIVDVGVDVPTTLWGATVFGGWRLGAGDFPLYDGKAKTNDGGEVRLGLLVPLLRDGAIDRRRAGIEKLSLEQQVQEQTIRLARLEIRRQAALAWVAWVAAGARVDVARQLLQLAEDRDRQLRDRVAAGDVAAVDRRDNERLIAQRRARLAAAARAEERAALDLSLYLRDERGVPIVVDESRRVPLTPPETIERPRSVLIDEAYARRPELLRVALFAAQVEVDRRAAENQVLPGLSVSASASQDLGPTSPPSSSSSSVWAPSPSTRAVPEIEVGLSFELPVPLRQARGRLAVTEAQRSRVEQTRRLLRDRIAVEVDDARSATRAAAARLAAARDEVDAAAAVEEAERARFLAGDTTLVIVNLRESATAEARLALIDAGVEAWQAEIALRAATGRLLDDAA